MHNIPRDGSDEHVALLYLSTGDPPLSDESDDTLTSLQIEPKNEDVKLILPS
jgi:hypothetical protein